MPNANRLSLHALVFPRPGVRTVRETTLTPIVAGLGVLAALLAGIGGKLLHRGWTARKNRNSEDESEKEDQDRKEKGDKDANA
jgi:hypothetical protein